MKKQSRIIALLLCVLLVCFMAVGCGDNGTTDTESKATGESQTESQTTGGGSTATAADLAEDFTDVSDWSGVNAQIEAGGKITVVKTEADAADADVVTGYVQKTVKANFDEFPVLKFTMSDFSDEARVHILINTGKPEDELPDVFITDPSFSAGGTFNINFRDYCGITGENEVTLKIAILCEQAQNHDNAIGMSAVVSKIEPVSKADWEAYCQSVEATIQDFSDIGAWNVVDHGKIEKVEGGAKFTHLGAGSSGYVGKTVEYDVSKFPTLQVDVTEISEESRFHILAHQRGFDYDNFITTTEETDPGIYKLDLQGQTGWEGITNYRLKVAVCGVENGTVVVKEIRGLEE